MSTDGKIKRTSSINPMELYDSARQDFIVSQMRPGPCEHPEVTSGTLNGYPESFECLKNLVFPEYSEILGP